MKKLIHILIASALVLFVGCSEDYLERVPTDSITDTDLFSTVVGAQTAIHGIHRSTYQYYRAHDKFGQKAVDLAMDLLGEDMYQTTRGYGWFVSWYQYLDHRNINSSNLEYVWEYYYDIVDNANLIIQNIDNASDAALNVERVNNIKGQALTYRAYSFYQLVQLYASRYVIGGTNSQLGIPIPIVASQEGLARSTVDQVYTQIFKDINDAIAAFEAAPSIGRANKSEINLRVAQGMKARFSLTTGKWEDAAAMAHAARTGYLPTNDNESGMNSTTDQEWIWGAVLIDEQQTSYASFFSHIDPLFGGYATLGNHKCLSTDVYNFMSDTDTRKSMFATIAGKPRVGLKFTGWGEWTNDYLYMKAGEMYLIEAEALARQDKFAEAQDVLFDLISTRDPAYVKSALTGDELIAHILMHRRADLWGEGFRFLDIKRLGIPLDRRNLGHNETLWNGVDFREATSLDLIFLIPKQEMDANPLMVQNEIE